MRKKNSGLGRGLDAIFLDNTLEEKVGGENVITVLKTSLIDPKRDQPRKYFDKDALEELASSIRENGLLQPILVREYGEGRYQIIAGERRFRASKLAELSEIPAIILDRDDRKVAELSLIENIQREDLNPIEEAMAFRALATEYGLTQEELSEKVGKSRSAITNAMRLLDLPDDVTVLLRDGAISAGHARAILGLEDPADMISLAKKTVENGLSVRAVEEAVRLINKKKAALADAPEEPADSGKIEIDYLADIEHRLMRSLGRKVKITSKGKNKKITLEFRDEEDFEALVKLLDPEAID